MSAILVYNKLHAMFWRSEIKPTLSFISGGQQDGYEFINCLDNSSGTSFKVSGGTQAVIEITFPTTTKLNGLGVYGHNLALNQSLKIEYSGSTTGSYSLFKDTDEYNGRLVQHSHIYGPSRQGVAYGQFLSGSMASVDVKRLKITTINWTSDSYIQNFSMGMWITEGVDIQAPFTPAYFQTVESSMKRNNKANPLITDLRKIPQKLKINFNQFSNDDLQTSQGDVTKATIKGDYRNHPLVYFMGYFMSREPFFLMAEVGQAPTASFTIEDRNDINDERAKLYYCTTDKVLKQPRYTDGVTLTWQVGAAGYIE
tara:strand:+ start:2575 stop:3510 length:936 start_codon:yes stop_codon:yes gene_type:complete